MTIDVVTMGECLVALVAEPGTSLAEAITLRRYVAGAEANVAVGLARLGHRSAYVGRIGGDGFGRGVLHRLRGEGVDVSNLHVDVNGRTGLLVRERRAVGSSEVDYHRQGSAAADLGPDDVSAAEAVISGARIAHITGITPALSSSCRAAAERFVQVAREAAVAVSFDVNLRTRLWSPEEARSVVLSLAGGAAVVFVGLDEGRTMFGDSGLDAGQLAARLLAVGARNVVVKLGPKGAELHAASAEAIRVEAVPVVQVVDVVGAGDAFAAGYLSGILDGATAHECLSRGNLCGAFAVASAGDLDGLPTRAELDRAVAGAPDVIR